MNKRFIAAGAAALLTLLATTACDPFGDKASEPWKDAGRTSQDNNGKAQVVTMPDGFNNVATKCLGDGLRVTTSYHANGSYAALAVSADPACTGTIPQN